MNGAPGIGGGRHGWASRDFSQALKSAGGRTRKGGEHAVVAHAADLGAEEWRSRRGVSGVKWMWVVWPGIAFCLMRISGDGEAVG